MQKIQEELMKLKEDHDSTKKINQQANDHMEKVKIHLNNNEELLEKYETKLAEYNRVEPQNDKAANDWQSNIMQGKSIISISINLFFIIFINFSFGKAES